MVSAASPEPPAGDAGWAGSDGVRAWGQVVLWTASIRSRPAATKAPTGLAKVLAVGAVTLVMPHLYSHNTSWG